jgi:hypothetical protein
MSGVGVWNFLLRRAKMPVMMKRLRKLASLAVVALLSLGELIGYVIETFVRDPKPRVEYVKPMVENVPRFDPPDEHVRDLVIAEHPSDDAPGIVEISTVPFAEDEAPLYLAVAGRSPFSVTGNHATDWFLLQ